MLTLCMITIIIIKPKVLPDDGQHQSGPDPARPPDCYYYYYCYYHYYYYYYTTTTNNSNSNNVSINTYINTNTDTDTNTNTNTNTNAITITITNTTNTNHNNHTNHNSHNANNDIHDVHDITNSDSNSNSNSSDNSRAVSDRVGETENWGDWCGSETCFYTLRQQNCTCHPSSVFFAWEGINGHPSAFKSAAATQVHVALVTCCDALALGRRFADL